MSKLTGQLHQLCFSTAPMECSTDQKTNQIMYSLCRDVQIPLSSPWQNGGYLWKACVCLKKAALLWSYYVRVHYAKTSVAKETHGRPHRKQKQKGSLLGVL